MKKTSGDFFEKIKQFGLSFVRPELSIRQKLVNIAIILCVTIQIPTIINSILIGSNFVAILSQILATILLVIMLSYGNKHIDSKMPPIVLTVGINLILFPLMYFGSGGRHSGMLPWMIMGAIFTWILLEGALCYIVFALNVVIDVGVFAVEWHFPEKVNFLGAHEELIDATISYIVVSTIFGIIFKYQTSVYEKQRKMLEEQDERLRAANADLERASKAKSDFLAKMSHEIRTPINAVLGMDEMILRESNDEQILGYAEDIDAAGNQLLSIINDILDLSKIESGKMELHPAEYELFSILNDSYNMINLRAKKKNLDFVIENESAIPAFLYGDEVRVRQIIVNLLTNAVKYTHEGYIKLNLSHREIDEDHIVLCITVKDTGIGISEENLDKLFESFARFDEKKNENVEGTGLGLAITHQFVSMMNGKIWAESNYGYGTTFYVEIEQIVSQHVEMGDFAAKLQKKTARTGDKTKADAVSYTAPEARILVVDDVKMNLNVVRLLLKRTQIQIDLALSGKESLDCCKLKHYDLILMDHMMPEMDGIEALHELRKMDYSLNQDTPVIALTANAIAGVEQMYLSEGFASYLSKPVKSDELEKVLLKYLPEGKIIRNE